MINRKMLIYLTALFIIFINGFGTNVKAEELNADSYTVLPIETLFNSGEEETIRPDLMEYSKLYFKGDNLLIPSYFRAFSIVDDESASVYRWNSEISYSKIKTDFELPEDFERSNDKIEIGFEYASRDPLLFKPIHSDEAYISKKYFEVLKDYPRYAAFIKGEKVWAFDFEWIFMKDEFGNKIEVPSEEMSVESYLETIYKKHVPKAYWPVSFVFSIENPNPTIPILKEELLNQDKSEIDILLLFDQSGDISLKKVVLINSNRGETFWEFHDFFTGEVIIDAHKYMSKNLKIDSFETYAVISRLDNIGLYMDHFLYSKNLEKDGLMEKIQYIINDTNTVGDIIEAYQALPLEYQMDYSYFDFTNSPDVAKP